MHTDVVVIGGGPAGLAAATYCARAGKRVVLFEKARALGGRSATLVKEGFAFNQGLRALYRGGSAERVLRDLGVPIAGTRAPSSGILFWDRGSLTAMPVGFVTLAATGALPARSKLTAARIFMKLDRDALDSVPDVSLADYVGSLTGDAAIRRVVDAAFRIATYTRNASLVPARVAVPQLRRAAHAGVLYLDGGWQPLVDGLAAAARAAAVTLRPGATVEAVEPGSVRVDGATFECDAIILAVPPRAAAALAPIAARNTEPILASCLDIAVSRLPDPRRRAVVGLGADETFFFNVQSLVAKIAPGGGALISVVEYLLPDARGERSTLERIVDVLQPGWRDVTVHTQFLPRMVVAADHPRALEGGADTHVATGLPNVFGAGDGWGHEMLLDGALGSARDAAMLAIQAVAGLPARSASTASDGRIHARVA